MSSQVGTPEAESEMEVSLQVFLEGCSEIDPCGMEGQEAEGVGGDPSGPGGAVELGEPFRAVLSWLEMAGSLILFPAITHCSVAGCGPL